MVGKQRWCKCKRCMQVVRWTNNFSGLSDGCGATGAATVTFTATDSCGNATSTTATFTIVDTNRTDDRYRGIRLNGSLRRTRQHSSISMVGEQWWCECK
ncbi:MAG: hypothetical protein IPI52_15290 [Bacteroidetes bacterium]|nr:hypothetical protein [Bacteroidota bacterium]